MKKNLELIENNPAILCQFLNELSREGKRFTATPRYNKSMELVGFAIWYW